MQAKTVDDYIQSLDPWQADTVLAIRSLFHRLAPEANEVFKWGQPVYEVNGPVAYVSAFNQYVNFGFWRGAELDDPENLLEGDGSKMRHLKIIRGTDLRPHTVQGFVNQAIALNKTSGNPTQRKTS